VASPRYINRDHDFRVIVY